MMDGPMMDSQNIDRGQTGWMTDRLSMSGGLTDGGWTNDG